VRDIGICVDTSGAEISVEGKLNVVDWGMFEVAKMDDIVEFDVDVIRTGEGVGPALVVKVDLGVTGFK
ncbi:hypothetical protein KI387_017875, partial [Taxus chinensis]